ncbi:hypothetical protein [Nonomuraea aurantiaca]|uniref:hypothetical protein n=1 Tax=Nonomuraea aurantiaca TaxID=2878562 RepID=UPI001CDA2922|nr:hypothetical protein [Nonomuraea aurantiaca]MCA2225157.1 hypothetical protein [Nonomuraea aurantiaca]
MSAVMLRSRWTSGPAADIVGPVLVAVTAYQADRARDLPGIYRAGIALRRDWPDLEGAVGMWLWTRPLELRCGSVSIWRDEQALRGFVGWPEHVTIVRRYRGRGRLTSTTWNAAGFEPAAIWSEARPHLRNEAPAQ